MRKVILYRNSKMQNPLALITLPRPARAGPIDGAVDAADERLAGRLGPPTLRLRGVYCWTWVILRCCSDACAALLTVTPW